MMEPPPLTLCPWDTEFFGMPIARLNASRLMPDWIQPVREWCGARRVRCLYFLADASDRQTVQLAERHGFHLADVRLTFERPCDEAAATEKPPGGADIRPAQADDVPALQAIARVSHRDSRFYFDGRFPVERCDALYATWIARSCQGFADQVFVGQCGGQVAGYTTVKQAAPDTAEIGLVGVAAAAQGRGLGPALVRAAVDWSAARGLARIVVVTQGRNRAAQRLYQRCGFLTHLLQLWYHCWFD
jgi:dTDP-4-amino-4,6-dideoxy-D-galactose acyltransferase